MVYFQIAASFFLKTAIKKMWQLFFFLQMFCALPSLQIDYPVNVEITFEQFRLIVFFEMLKPEKLMEVFGVKLDFTLDELLFGKEQDDAALPFQVNMKTYVVLIILVALALCGLFIFAFLTFYYTKKVMNFFVKTIKGFMWNNSIKVIYISYLPQSISIMHQMIMMIVLGKDLGATGQWLAISIASILTVTPIAMFKWLQKHKHEIKDNQLLD